MSDLRVGALARAVRHRMKWTQQMVAARAGVSQHLVSLFERGHLGQLTVRSARAIAAALEIHLPSIRAGEAVTGCVSSTANMRDW